jgi:6-phosphofructokinase 1
VYIPERPVSVDRIAADVADAYGRHGWCVVVLCENQPDPNGSVLGVSGKPRWTDAFGHPYYASPADFLAGELQRRLGVRVRFDKPGTIQRMATAYVSTVDRAEAELVGRTAVRYALNGRSDVMVTLERASDSPYTVTTSAAPLETIANQQRRLPDEFINSDANVLTPQFEAYARPLLGEPLAELVSFA